MAHDPDDAPATVRRPSVTPTASTPDPARFAQSYEKLLAKAKALSAVDVKPCRAPVAFAARNYCRGFAAVAPYEAKLRVEIHGISFDAVTEGVEVSEALLFAESKVGGASHDEIAKKLERVRELREPMLGTVEILARLGVIPAERTAQIREGSGNFDTAQDGVDLHALFHEFGDLLRGKHPFPEDEIEEIGRLGAWLVEHLPKLSDTGAPVGGDDAENIRDRFWTLLVNRSVLLRKLGYYLFGDSFNDQTPPLLSSE